MMQGTPYIFEGEELGMTNAFFDKIEDYRDLEAIDIFKDFTGRKGFSEKDTLELLRLKSRDNARTPMQWDDTRHAGFTEGIPWIDVNQIIQRLMQKNVWKIRILYFTIIRSL